MTAAAHAAATLILVRDGDRSPPELLMIQRSAVMAFGPGAWVFPGGRVDPGDRALAAASLPAGVAPDDDQAARIAAIRETIEEAGVAVGLDPAPDPETLAILRAALHAGEPFAALLDRFGLRLAPEMLVPFSRWRPDESVTRRFDTRFYLARAPYETTVDPDGGETIAICWATAGDMLARDDAKIMFPTMCNLRRIASHASFADLATHAASFSSGLIVPDIRKIDGEEWLCIPDGFGYPDIRMTMADMLRS